jgi:ATP-dependent RNA helicase DBP3
MPKRPFDDNRVGTLPTENTNTNGVKNKKRKVESRDENSLISNGPAPEASRSKEDGELRRLKKIEKRSGNPKPAQEEENKNASSDGREGKKDEKEKKKQVAKAARKAARKAEKAGIKAVKEGRDKSKVETPIPALELGGARNGNNPSQQLPQKRGENSTNKSSYTEDPHLTALSEAEVESFLRANYITVSDPTSSAPLRPIINFSQLPATKILGKSPFANFKSPTPIQAASWPFLLSGRDVIGVAETGSGKTLAFGIPCVRSISSAIPKSNSRRAVTKAVIVSPTRELAVQIHDQIFQLANSAGLKTACVYGGVPKDPQREALAKAHIVVATPGRLNDLISDGAADLSKVNYLVLDEADRMLDKGFEQDIRKIISSTSPSSSGRQTLMFTATWPPSVRALASTFMNSPVHISIGKDNPTGELRANTSITQKVEVLSPYDKEARLLQILKAHQSGASARDRVLVFCLYKKEAVRVENFLRMRGRNVVAIHGDMNQVSRSKSLEAFRQGECPLLVATDVAARGLDIPEVKLVLNMTFPLTVEDYVHRIGR